MSIFLAVESIVFFVGSSSFPMHLYLLPLLHGPFLRFLLPQKAKNRSIFL
jgi:hypothetical protein